MNQSTIEAYAEVDTILSFMDKELVEQIPEKLRKMFKKRNTKDLAKKINPNLPIEDQFLNEETLSILAVLNYNYWCKDEQKKAELLKKYAENENISQEKAREKYNPDNIFNKRNQQNKIEENTTQNEVAMVEYKESIFKKFINKIKNIFKIR